MELRRNEEVIKPSSGDFISRQTTHAISSLNEAWCHILDEYAVDTPLDRIILPIMRDCFFGGAVYALFLLQKGHGDQVVSDIAGFTTKEPRS